MTFSNFTSKCVRMRSPLRTKKNHTEHRQTDRQTNIHTRIKHTHAVSEDTFSTVRSQSRRRGQRVPGLAMGWDPSGLKLTSLMSFSCRRDSAGRHSQHGGGPAFRLWGLRLGANTLCTQPNAWEDFCLSLYDDNAEHNG